MRDVLRTLRDRQSAFSFVSGMRFLGRFAQVILALGAGQGDDHESALLGALHRDDEGSRMLKSVAIGLIRVDPYASRAERARLRIALGALAAAEGFGIAEVFEVVGDPMRDHAWLEALERLARRTEVTTLLTAGNVSSPLLARILSGTYLTTRSLDSRAVAGPAAK